jgi:hypothetical protein
MSPTSSSSFWSALAATAAFVLAACSGASNGIGNGNGPAPTCVSTPCGAGGNTIQTCTSQPQGGCSAVTYTVGSQSFSCNSCMGCTGAAEQAATACVGGGPGDGGTNDGSVDGGNQTCSAAMACGTNGDHYQECTTVDSMGGCLSIDYKTSDGRNFTCSGCQNCAGIAQNLQTYCATNPSGDAGTGTTTCSPALQCGNTGDTYQECTTTNGGGTCTGVAYRVSNGVSYTCASCSDCSSAIESLDSFCAGSVTPVTNCTTWAACSTSSLEYEQCTVSENGSCTSVYYETSDAQTFSCNSCADCSAALSSMESYCTSTVQPVTTCGAYSACGSTGVEYQLCTTTTGGTCTGEYYSTTSGNTYTCSGCDCTTASSQLSSYCASLTSGNVCSPACGSGDICCSCTGTLECLSSNNGVDTCASYGCQ